MKIIQKGPAVCLIIIHTAGPFDNTPINVKPFLTIYIYSTPFACGKKSANKVIQSLEV